MEVFIGRRMRAENWRSPLVVDIVLSLIALGLGLMCLSPVWYAASPKAVEYRSALKPVEVEKVQAIHKPKPQGPVKVSWSPSQLDIGLADASNQVEHLGQLAAEKQKQQSK